ncbi:hypothetical protein [Kitasatospora sp. NPDC101183]|uniref:hypothetical protein n=1 Tax=Kitasatospora sp. NPDC101183 TaxID=3364100 RepID=UPI0037F9FC95
MTTAIRSKCLPVVRDCRLVALTDGVKGSTRHLSVYEARTAVRGWRRDGESVHTYRTTDRDGADMVVANVQIAPGRWSGVTRVNFVYEIPVESLLDL